MLRFVESTDYKKNNINERVCQQVAAALKNPEVIIELGFIAFNWTHLRTVQDSKDLGIANYQYFI